jgi:long-chain acyl-CoA synthetase
MGIPLEGVQTVATLWDRLLQHVDHETPFIFADPTGPRYQLTYREMNAKAHCLAAFLMMKGIQTGQCVAVLGERHPLYACFDLATQLGGTVNMTLDPEWADAETEALLTETNAVAILIPTYEAYRSRKALYDRFAARLPILCHCLRPDDVQEDDRIMLLENALVQGNVYWREHYAEMKDLKANIRPSDVATLAFSRTGGVLTGVVLSQMNLIAAVLGLADRLQQLSESPRISSTLGPSDITERTAGLYLNWWLRGTFHYLADNAKLPSFIANERPTYLLASPSSLADLQTCIEVDFRARYWIRRRWLNGALTAAKAFLLGKQEKGKLPFGLKLKYGWYNRQVLRPIKQRYLSSVRYIFCQGIGLSSDTELFFHSTHTPILAGLSRPEMAGFLSLNGPQDAQIGTMGLPLAGVRYQMPASGLRVAGPQRMIQSWNGRIPQDYADLQLVLGLNEQGHLRLMNSLG